MKKLFGLAVIASLFICGAAYAEGLPQDFKINLDAGVSTVIGDNSYDFSFMVVDPLAGESRLEWDIDNYMLDLGIGLDIRDTFVISFDYSTAISGDEGTMTDKDWYRIDKNMLLVSDTDSDTESDGTISNFRFTWKLPTFLPTDDFRLSAYAGYMNQKWDGYEAKNVYVKSSLLGGTTDTSGTTFVTYEVEHKIPYVGVGLDFVPNEIFSFNFGFDYSSIVDTQDKDDHVVRGKTIETDAGGSYIGFKGEVAWHFRKNMKLALMYKTIAIETDGTQTQTWYKDEPGAPAGTVITIDRAEVTSDQSYWGLKGTILFN